MELVVVEDIVVLEEIGLDLVWLFVVGIAEGFEAVELFVAQKHIDAGYEDCRVLREIIHDF